MLDLFRNHIVGFPTRRFILQNNHAVQQSPAPERSPSSEMPDVFTPDYPLESEAEKFYQVTMLLLNQSYNISLSFSYKACGISALP